MKNDLSSIRSVLKDERKKLMSLGNVVGTGIGYKTINGEKTDNLGIICSVKSKLPAGSISADALVPSTIQDVPTDVVEVGEVKAQQDPKGKFRPAPGGVSIGHRSVTAGTLGCWVKKNGKFHLLSNNHVIANSNNASIGDRILQPGSFDSGTDYIATLSDFVRIKFGGEDNLVDAAIAQALEGGDGGDSGCSVANAIANILNGGASTMGRKTRLKPVKVLAVEDIVRDEVLNIGKISELGEATLGMEVKKMGRTTGLTFGTVTQIDVSIRVSYGTQSANFIDQVLTTDMSDGGDSGSVVVHKDNHKMVGLLFAGSDLVTVINRSQNVFSALDITF